MEMTWVGFEPADIRYAQTRFSADNSLQQPGDAVWVVGQHRCAAQAGAFIRQLFVTSGVNVIPGAMSCGCACVVPEDVWHRWQCLSALERALWSVRTTEAR